jgi:bifunctional non-homologous end joining protein LigD
MKSKFSIQIHKRKNITHWDLRVLSPKKTHLISWAIPKEKFPKKGEKILAIRTVDHKVNYLNFSGTLNSGDKVEIYDIGDCDIIKWKQDLIIVKFSGKKIKGVFLFIKMKNSKQDDWLILRSGKK